MAIPAAHIPCENVPPLRLKAVSQLTEFCDLGQRVTTLWIAPREHSLPAERDHQGEPPRSLWLAVFEIKAVVNLDERDVEIDLLCLELAEGAPTGV